MKLIRALIEFPARENMGADWHCIPVPPLELILSVSVVFRETEKKGKVLTLHFTKEITVHSGEQSGCFICQLCFSSVLCWLWMNEGTQNSGCSYSRLTHAAYWQKPMITSVWDFSCCDDTGVIKWWLFSQLFRTCVIQCWEGWK